MSPLSNQCHDMTLIHATSSSGTESNFVNTSRGDKMVGPLHQIPFLPIYGNLDNILPMEPRLSQWETPHSQRNLHNPKWNFHIPNTI